MDVTKQCRDIKELSPNAQIACNLFMARCKEARLEILITETYRSQARQNYLYEQGRTRPGQIVTWTKKSNHTGRNAWDICKNIKGQEYDDKNFFKEAGKIAADLGITWGGKWTTPDTPHFEIPKDWKEPIKEDLEYKKAVTALAQAININNSSWYPKPNPKNVLALVQKIGNKMYGIIDYKFIVHRMQQDKIISDVALWLDHNYKEQHIKALIKKIAARF